MISCDTSIQMTGSKHGIVYMCSVSETGAYMARCFVDVDAEGNVADA
jgi:hypothetical protein